MVMLSTIHAFCHRLLKEEGRTFEVVSGRRQVYLVSVHKSPKLAARWIGRRGAGQ